MDEVTIDQVLAQLRKELKLSKETEYEVLAEIRTHLEDAVADAVAKGEDEQVALWKAAEKFGVEEVVVELQQVHEGREVVDAVAITGLPIVFALILRWLAFAPDGSFVEWSVLLARPGFWVVALIALVAPFLYFNRWRFALVGWLFFWLLTVIFVVYPSITHW